MTARHERFHSIPRPLRMAPLVVLVLGGVLATSLVVRQRAENARVARASFERSVASTLERMQRAFGTYEYQLRGARGAVIGAGGASVTRERFAAYARSRDIAREFPGALGHGFVRRVPEGEEEAFLARSRRDGWPDLRIRELSAHPGEHFVIEYVEPVAENAPAIGLDCASEPSRRDAALRAMRSGEPALTAVIDLVQLSGPERAGVLMMLAVVPDGRRDLDASERERRTIGWSYAPLSLARVLGPLDLSQSDELEVSVTDVTNPSAERPIWSAPSTDGTVPGLRRSDVVALYGRTWRIDTAARPTLLASLRLPHPWQSGLWAGLVGVLLAATGRSGIRRMERRQRAALDRRLELESAVLMRTEELARASERLQLASSAARMGVWDWDVRTNAIVWDEMACELYGLPPGGFGGKYESWRAHVHPDDIARVEALLQDAVQGTRDYVTTFRIRRADGVERQMNAAALVRRDVAGAPLRVVGVNWDVTEQREAEEALRRSEAALAERSEQAESASAAKTMFLASMSHELRTPMNAITGVAYLLERTELSADQRELLRTIGRSTRTLLGMINDILDLSKIEAGQLSLDSLPFRLAEALDEVRAVMTAYAVGKELALSFEGLDALPTVVLGDRVRVVQVLTNLVGNAIKYTERGSIRVVASSMPGGAGRARVRISVEDSGPGIPAEALARLFTPFTQLGKNAAHRAGGTGLGLAIVKQLVSRMDGVVGVESTVGRGTTFWFELPFVLAAADEQVPVVRPARGGQRLAAARVLVVDDSDVNRVIARRILELEGAQVEVARTGSEAVERVRVSRAPFDVVLMDVQMPEMDGIEATERIRVDHASAELSIVALTAGALASERERALGAGMDAFVSKPFEPELLIATVARHVERRGAHVRAVAAADRRVVVEPA